MGNPTTFDHHQTGTSAALDAGQTISVLEQTTHTAEEGGVPFLVKRDGSVLSLENLLSKPARHKAKPTFTDAESFIKYVNLYKNAASLVFATISTAGASFRAMLDIAAPNDRSWNDHTALFALGTTPEWKQWLDNDNEWMSQEDFCHFIKSHTQHFYQPSGADFLELSHSIEATVGGNYKSGVRLQSGDRTLLVDMTTVATAKMSEASVPVPESFQLVLAPFAGQNPQQVEAFLRFRCTGSGVTFKYELQGLEKAIEVSALEARSRIETETTLPVFNGTYAQ